MSCVEENSFVRLQGFGEQHYKHDFFKRDKEENPQGSLRWHISQISFRNVVFLQTPSQNDTGRTNVSFKKIGGGRMVGSFDVIFFKSLEHHKKKKNYIHQNYTG